MQLDGFDFDQEKFYQEEMEFVVFEYYNYSMVMGLQQINQVIYIGDQKTVRNVGR
jgi:hypothetical protein